MDYVRRSSFYLKSGSEKLLRLSRISGTALPPGSPPKVMNFSMSVRRNPGPASLVFASLGTTPAISSVSCARKESPPPPRAGWVRTSPHFYIRPEEIDRMIDLLP